MADLIVRKSPGAGPASLRGDLEPLRFVRDLLHWDPFQEMAPLLPSEVRGLTFNPAFDVKETEHAYLFKADMPGIKEQDMEVTVTSNRITVNGKREEEKEERDNTYYACERTYGSFSRAFTLPEGADLEHIRAELKHGVLTIAVPKKPEVQPKKVPVSFSEKASKV